ncbi:MAG: HAD family hydrolase [Moraxellaceae bacterium]|nr:HAD family hydrolase [Pseudobdellovibrionaceae bacterium]
MIFENITHLYQELKTNNKHSLCVFDLDSTLFNVSPRSEKILHEFAVDRNFPELLKIKIQMEDWGIYEALLRAGYDKVQNEDLHQNLKKYWNEKFFSHEYIHYDTPYLGAIHFVQSLKLSGVGIKYLTGRDVFRMGQGTAEVLKKWGLPCDPAQIHLKPQKEMDDHLFKLEWLQKLAQDHPKSQIYFFENEPVNINLVGDHMPNVRLIYMNTTHSRRDNVRALHTEIFNYTIERD